jgi:hypothetical protein
VELSLSRLFDYGLAGVALLMIAQFHWYAVRKTIPGLIAAFRSEIHAERDSHDRHISQLVASLDAIRGEVHDLRTTLEAARPLRIYRPGHDTDPAA